MRSLYLITIKITLMRRSVIYIFMGKKGIYIYLFIVIHVFMLILFLTFNIIDRVMIDLKFGFVKCKKYNSVKNIFIIKQSFLY